MIRESKSDSRLYLGGHIEHFGDLFQNAFGYFKTGYASAMAWVLFLIILALTAFQFRLAPKWVRYEADS